MLIDKQTYAVFPRPEFIKPLICLRRPARSFGE